MRPLIYGYINVWPCTTDRDVQRLTPELADYTAREGFTLAEVFVERSYPESVALSALTDALRRTETRAVVIPALCHFAQRPSLRLGVKENLERTHGVQVFVLYPLAERVPKGSRRVVVEAMDDPAVLSRVLAALENL